MKREDIKCGKKHFIVNFQSNWENFCISEVIISRFFESYAQYKDGNKICFIGFEEIFPTYGQAREYFDKKEIVRKMRVSYNQGIRSGKWHRCKLDDLRINVSNEFKLGYEVGLRIAEDERTLGIVDS